MLSLESTSKVVLTITLFGYYNRTFWKVLPKHEMLCNFSEISQPFLAALPHQKWLVLLTTASTWHGLPRPTLASLASWATTWKNARRGVIFGVLLTLQMSLSKVSSFSELGALVYHSFFGFNSIQLYWTFYDWFCFSSLLEKKRAVTDVVAGNEYEFRVYAINVSGLSEPSSPSEFIFAKDPKSKSYILSKCEQHVQL
jgi:hypothetical protein